MTGLRVLVVDDQAIARAGVRMLLEGEPDLEVVGEVADGLDAVRRARQLEPDVVLVDVRMPELDGIEATRRMVAAPRPPAVLVLTTFDLDEYVFGALRAGAAGFLLKDCEPEQLLNGVRAVARGEMVLGPAATRRVVAAAVRDAQAPGAVPRAATTALQRLSAREREVFEAVARGLSNAEIAAEFFVTEHTVKTHVSSVLAKLGLASRLQAVIAAYEWRVVSPGAGR